MELTFSPNSLPGACKSCGGSGPEKMPMVDTKTSEEFHGAVYYCRECLYTMAALFGFTLPENSEEIKDKLTYVLVENVRLQEVIVSLEGAIDGLVSSGKYSLTGVSDPILHETLADSEAGLRDSNNPSGSGEGKTSESSNDSLLAGLHSDKQQFTDSEEFKLTL